MAGIPVEETLFLTPLPEAKLVLKGTLGTWAWLTDRKATLQPSSVHMDGPLKHDAIKKNKASHKREYIIWFYLYEMSRIGKPVKTESN